MTTNKVYTVNEIKAIESNCGIKANALMENAADAVIRRIERLGLLRGDISIVCGSGNNGGDGYAIAWKMLGKSLNVKVVQAVPPSSDLAVEYCKKYTESGGLIGTRLAAIERSDLVIDCLFGFSFHGKAEGVFEEAIKQINGGAYVVAVDLPSGICADGDELSEIYVKADLTCTFTSPKLATASYPAKEACGKVYVEDIGIPKETLDLYDSRMTVSDKSLLSKLPSRPSNSHKGTYGALLAICGCDEMCGAAALSCLGALRSGVGLVRLFTDDACANAVKHSIFEVIAFSDRARLDGAISRSSAVLLGCGCGRKHDEIFEKILLSSTVPVIIDADGINFLSERINLYRSVTCPVVITPHPAEMARLTGLSVEEVNASRVKCAQAVARKFGFITVLKGAGTVIAAPDGTTRINVNGNTGLAKGGSGDVLAGVIASLTAQGLSPFDAASLGVYLHGAAADRLAAVKGVYAMLSHELPEVIGKIMYFGDDI